MDLTSLISELHLRGFDQGKVDDSLRLLVHVYEVQDYASAERGGVLAADILTTYETEVVQAAIELFLERSMVNGREAFRLKWGCESVAKIEDRELWDHGSPRWGEFVSQLDERYLGFCIPQSEEGERIIENWKLNKELKWFSVALQQHGWNVLKMIDDLAQVALSLELAYGFRSFGPEGVKGKRVLLHEAAYAALRSRMAVPPTEARRGIQLWKFFSEYDVRSTDFVALMRECGLGLNEVIDQLKKFNASGLTSEYREGLYPPYLVNDKRREVFLAAVKDLLRPMDDWLSRRGQAKEHVSPLAAKTAEV